MRKIELLAPARNLDTGIAAINSGADAVYIGPEKFSARSAAGNSTGDIARLVRHAHMYNVKVYAAVNTILYNDELKDAEKLITDLYDCGVDAVIIQDMGILEMNIPRIALHASTQSDNYNIERIRFLDRIGFPRIVLARELSLQQIKEIRNGTECELEFFIHGALCVSLSGRCYMSASSGGRSANRGECAQPCRKSYTFEDADGNIISKNRYPLSLKDMNQTSNLQDLIDAGVDSLKIEGRLKEISYVKNIVAHYRTELDRILEGRNDLRKASSGSVYLDFKPDPHKTFNRDYTDYFIRGRSDLISSPLTPKSIGKKIGSVTEVSTIWFSISSEEKIHNGDGLAFFDREKNLTGIKVNSVDGSRISPLSMNGIYKDALIYRNHDAMFEKELSAGGTKRNIEILMEFSETENGFALAITDEDNFSVTYGLEIQKEISRSDKTAPEQIKKQLSKLGDTIFSVKDISVFLTDNYFIPVSALNKLRRNAVEQLLLNRFNEYTFSRFQFTKSEIPYPYKKIDFMHNVSNHLAEQFYRRHGVEIIEQSFETAGYRITGPLMTTKLCLKYENSICSKQRNKNPNFKEPFYLTDRNTRYRIEFDCKNCFMLIFKN